MPDIPASVLTTVNAPYADAVTSEQLAILISDPSSAARGDTHAFAFFSEVSVYLQIRFINEMQVDPALTQATAREFQKLAGFKLHLASDDYGGLDLEDWAEALKQDVEERYGPVPDNLVQVGKSGW